MQSNLVNMNICELEEIIAAQQTGTGSGFTQDQMNAMIQLAMCFQGGNSPATDTDNQMFAAAINNVMQQLFPKGTLPPGSSLATQQLFTDLTYVDPATGTSLAQAASSSNPGQAFSKMQTDIRALYSDSLDSSSPMCWFVNGRDQSGVPAYVPDTDDSLKNMLKQYIAQIGDIEAALFDSSPNGPLSPTNQPELFYVEMGNLAGFLKIVEAEAAKDKDNGYSHGITALFNQPLTLPGSSSPISLSQLLANYGNPPTAAEATALEEALYGNPPQPGNGQGVSGTLYEYFTEALNQAWGQGPQ